MPSPQHLLVFAHTPPPLHGQSVMVQTLVEGLPSFAPDITLHHVNPRLSVSTSDIGRWRPAKLFTLLAACFQALRLRARHGPMAFYYVPAPGKRSALHRDFIVMLLCRPFFRTLILHWHAIGLGAWLTLHATPLERWLAQQLLGRPALAIVLAPELAADARFLSARHIAVVPNGLDAPPTRNSKPKTQNGRPTEILFIGLCSPEKGLFDLLTALAIANRREPGAFHLTVAGGFASVRDQHAFFAQVLALGENLVRHVGLAEDAKKQALLAAADIFCFPTTYPHEGQPLALIEALAHDLPIITTRWRAIPSLLPPASEHILFVRPGRPDEIADALLALRHADPPTGQLHTHYLARYTRGHHLATLAAALRSVDTASIATPSRS